jgi:hypothetical protein
VTPRPQPRWLMVTVTVVAVALTVAGIVSVALVGAGPARPRRAVHRVAATQSVPSSPAAPHPGFSPVPAATVSPPPGPVQQQYDAAFRREFSSGQQAVVAARVAALVMPPPGIAGGWPALRPAEDPLTWSEEFTAGLLDINFARQSRAGLARWLVAESAPDLMPGIPPATASRTLYASVLAPGLFPGAQPVVPSAARWQVLARHRVRWVVSGLTVQVAPSWQSLVNAGWQPPDLRMVVEDVTGTLTIIQGRSRSAHGFSLAEQLGSAAWHPGYGTALVTWEG